jgi:hypothetical protein
MLLLSHPAQQQIAASDTSGCRLMTQCTWRGGTWTLGTRPAGWDDDAQCIAHACTEIALGSSHKTITKTRKLNRGTRHDITLQSHDMLQRRLPFHADLVLVPGTYEKAL